MRKLTFILPIFLLIGLSSCSPKLQPTSRVVLKTYFDYSNYANEGFLISPDPYTQKFEACGEISISIYPAKILKKQKNEAHPLSDSFYESKTTSTTYLEKENISSQELLKIVVEKAKKVGANALVNFKCVLKYDSYYSTTLSMYLNSFDHYEISGFAIKK